MYASFDNHMYGDHATYFAVSNDAGNTWKRITSPEFTGFAHVIREDIKNEKLLFAGTEMGLFISIDGGANWMRSKYQEMPWYNLVRDIKIQPQTGDLLIASHGRGIYIVDDLQPLRELVKSDINADVILYPVNDFIYDYSPQLPATGSNIDGYTAGNKAILPAINYYLKQRSESSIKIEIYDAANKKIKDIIAPRVPVGKYKVVLLAGGKKYEQLINIKPNDAKGFSAKSIDKLYQQAMRLYNVHEKLAVLVDTMDKAIATLTKIDNKTAANQTALAAIESMRKEILELERKTIFFDEFKYRRRLSDLYLEVATSLEPLSASKEGSIDLLEKEFMVFYNQFYGILKKNG